VSLLPILAEIETEYIPNMFLETLKQLGEGGRVP
jgi:hypothetical protein